MTQSLGLILQRDGEGYAFNAGQSAVVDFGHERWPSESLRVGIEEVIYVDPHWKVELVKATLPDTIIPLSLSVLNPDELENREVVLIGYPAWDARNETSLMLRILRGATEIKRMLPGRVHGRTAYSGKEALAHDCTTTGGCGGAPLIDLGTGHVAGVHFAGQYLTMNYAVPAADLAADARFKRAGVRFAGEPATKLPLHRIGTEGPQLDAAAKELVDVAMKKISEPVPAGTPDVDPTRDLTATEFDALEAIVIFDARPALLAGNWRSEVTDTWRPLLKPHEKRVDLALRAVGKLLIDIEHDRWTGTAFLVGDRLALTASFAAKDFVDGAGAHATIRPGTRAAIDFSDALGLPARSETTAVTAVKFIHPFFHLALLELERVPKGAAPLDIAAQMPSELAGRAIAVLSFAAPLGDPKTAHMTDTIYQNRWGRLFLQPGKALQLGQIPGSPGVPALVHDCWTTVGSEGAPVLDLGTGYVIGVHTHSKPLEGGFAQPTWELARDPHVWQYAIGLWPNPRPSWLNAWDALVPQQPPPLEMQPPGPARWTVDVIPIDWSQKEPKDLEQLLVSSIEAQMALYAAENAGLTIGTVNSAAPPMLLWRDIIKKASVAGVLRRLLEELAGAPQNAGIAPKLRMYL